MEDRNSKRRRKWQERKEAGLCAMCGKAPAEEGRTRCARCLARETESRKRKAEYLRSRHRCIHCGQEDAYTMQGRAYCSACIANQVRCARRHRQQLRSDGLCIRCGTRLPEGSEHMTCESCRMQEHSLRAERRAEHRCTKCGVRLPDDWDHAQCRECINKRWDHLQCRGSR